MNTAIARGRDGMVEIDMTGESLACLGMGTDRCTVVRKTTCGNFAVIASAPDEKKGGYRLLKVLPTLDRARAYNFAIHRS